MKTKNFKKTFELGPDLIITIERIVYSDLRGCKLISISNSAFAAVGSLMDDDEFNLPQIYAGLTLLTGHGDERYDDYKGSFSFTFKLNVKKPNHETEYAYHVVHYRSYVDFFVEEVALNVDPRDGRILHTPDEALLSDKDIRLFSMCFLKFATMYAEGKTIEPFVKSSDSNLILFGYLDNKYYYKQFEEEEEHDKTKLLLEEKLKELKNQLPSAKTDSS